MKDLIIIGNEKISHKDSLFHSANIDFQTLVKGLSQYFNVSLIARLSTEKQIFAIHHNKIVLASNIFNYALNILLSFINIRKNKYLIISISPYTFFAFLILFLFSSDIYLYLRSNGFKEYEKILGKKWVFLYSFMYFFFVKKAKIISCEKTLVKKKFFLVHPSELNRTWFKKRKKITLNKKINIIYVGRIRVEKGILDFVDLFSKFKKKFQLTIIGDRYNQKFNIKNVHYLNFFPNIKHLINEYDKNHILILPSYTESHPKVVYEALARLRPVLIFEDIEHIIKNSKGIFSCKRTKDDILKKINYILKNYRSIQKQILKNKLPTKNTFIKEFSEAINYN